MTTPVAANVREPAEPVSPVEDRLLVTVRDLETRQYRPVGFLTHSEGIYTFCYLRREVDQPGFRPLPGLARATTAAMHAPRLFPLFAERVVSARRPDRDTTIAALGLDTDAAPFEVLARSHGLRVGDTIELLPAPHANPGQAVAFTFLAHGVRHLPPANQARISDLLEGETLHLHRESHNSVNPRALLVTDGDSTRLGWVPDPLIGIIDRLGGCQVVVERASGPEVGFHLRLLVRVEGVLLQGDRLFAGADWQTVS